MLTAPRRPSRLKLASSESSVNEEILKPYKQDLIHFEEFLKSAFEKLDFKHAGVEKLYESVRYSLDSGGKRFRPLLSMMTAEALGQPQNRTFAFAAAVEFIHTYSLIHDDLPCMDNDDERRGRPSNHKAFGEDVALLAGDALLTESFRLIVKSYESEPKLATELVLLLSTAAGYQGMISGQIIDIMPGESGHDLDEVTKLHQLKTGALIRVAVEGAAVCCGASGVHRSALREFASNMGFAFQLADDIEDYDPQAPESASYITTTSLEQTKAELARRNQVCLDLLEPFGDQAKGLQSLVSMNTDRLG